MLTTALASLLLSAQMPAPPDQSAFSQCLAGFVGAQQQAGAAVADFANLLATACPEEERAYRAGYAAAAEARGVRLLDADGEAHRNALNLRNAYRDAFLATQTTCRRDTGRR